MFYTELTYACRSSSKNPAFRYTLHSADRLQREKKMQTSIVFWCFYFSHHIFIPITTPKINPTENIQLSDAKSWIVFIIPGNFPSAESLTPVLLINSEIRFQWMVIVTIPNFSAHWERINSTARYTRTVYPMWKRIQTTAHPKAAPRIGCLIGWLTKLRGHVRYDQTVDVMLLKSMTRNPDFALRRRIISLCSFAFATSHSRIFVEAKVQMCEWSQRNTMVFVLR